ncbi:hypothetical protein [Nannocystis sp. SCPEA4]|uniref:hypothetical protein n=1 Tax=Nannocystis sp. SCPEA4 TaxID=2996787 RepID=UPI0022707730|nr:hypothetical protein [Nannocystis sp. SCPEA4]
MVGTAAADVVSSATLNQCYVALGSNDQITITAASGRNAILGGPGLDTLTGGFGPALLYGGDGDDTLAARSDADFLSGGAGNDFQNGNGGNDILDGGAGDDTLRGEGGHDVIVPGAGKDTVYAGAGDDTVVIRNLCELQNLEWLAGELGNDTLVIPAPLATVTGMGVTVSSFENVVVMSSLDCGINCDCGQVAAPDANPCDFSSMGTNDDADLLEDKCLDAMAYILPSLVPGLAGTPVDADFEDLVLDFTTANPTYVTELNTQLNFAGKPLPPLPVLPPGDPMLDLQAGVRAGETPCDLPAYDPDDVPIGGSCSAAEIEVLDAALRSAKFYVWRAKRAVDEVDAFRNANDLLGAEALWNQGLGELSMRWWFGPFNEARLNAVKKGIDHLWLTFNGNYFAGTKARPQCWKPLTPWQYMKAILWQPGLIAAKYFLNPCWWHQVGWADSSAHAVLTPNIPWTLGLGYLPYTIEFCPNYFDAGADPRDQAATIVHELMHHQFNDFGEVVDKHEGFGCAEDRCYSEEDAHGLVPFSDALTNCSNYEWYVRYIGRAYSNSWCDAGTSHQNFNALCFPSECCGNGRIDAGEPEECDTNDFGQDPAGGGGETCWTQAGVNHGGLECTAACEIDTSGCFARCGDGTLETGEACDAPDFGGQTCESFGFETGSLSCDGCFAIGTGACEGGTTNSPPASYGDCDVDCGACPGPTCGHPELCYLETSAGLCEGGPCARTVPGNYVDGQFDHTSNFHPKGNFRDSENKLYRCEDIDSTEATCVDEFGWGVCKKCGLGDGETMLGCSCNVDSDCSLGVDLVCWGGEFPNGGFCWPLGGPPEFQCKQGGCGQGIRNGLGGEDASYCEHYADGEASCQPERCNQPQAETCGGFSPAQVCGTTNNPADCITECATNADCQLSGWPLGMTCSGGRCV